MAKRWMVAAGVLAVAMVFAVATVDARPGRGGGLGNRGTHTREAVPPTPTAPAAQRPAAPGQPVAQSARPAVPAAGAAAASGSLGSRLATGLAAGFLGAGLFGLLSGQGLFSGLGSLMGFLGLLLQVALIAIVIRLAWGFFTHGRQQAATAGGPSLDRTVVPHAAMAGAGAAAAVPGAAAAGQDRVGLGPEDFAQFEAALHGLMRAYETEDMATIRGGVTEAMAADLEREMAELRAAARRNRVGQPELLQGDLAESWWEDTAAWATVSMRYRLTDWLEDRATGRIVDGHPQQPVEVIEHWTFRRERAGQPWLLAGIEPYAG